MSEGRGYSFFGFLKTSNGKGFPQNHTPMIGVGALLESSFPGCRQFWGPVLMYCQALGTDFGRAHCIPGHETSSCLSAGIFEDE